MKKYLLLLLLISMATRFIALASYPAFWPDDEPEHAYDAYALLTTGKSFRNQSLPLFFYHFSQDQPTNIILYNYLQVPTIGMFGLNEFGARFPAALIGSLTTLSLFGLSYQLTRNKKIALFSALFLALSPWHIYISRHGLEAVTFPFLFLTGWYFLRRKIFLLADICLGLSFSSYQVATLMTPILIISSIKNLKKIFIPTLVFSTLFIASVITSNGAVFNHYQDVSGLGLGSATQWSIFATFFGTQILPISNLFYYLLPIIFLIYFAIIKIIKTKQFKHFHQLIIISLISFIPGALTSDTIKLDVNRSISKTGLLEIIAAIGLYFIIQSKNKKIILVISLLLVTNIYVLFKHNPYYYLSLSHPGFNFKPAITYVLEQSTNYENIVISLRLNQPFMYLLFYSKTPPSQFQNADVLWVKEMHKPSYEYVVKMGKYTFCHLDNCYRPNPNTLYLGTNTEQQNIKSLKTFGSKENGLRILDNIGGEGEI